MRKPLLYAAALSTFQTTRGDSLHPKRGLTYHNPGTRGEYDMFFADNSTITWYYNWSPYPSSSAPTSNIQFLPLIHGIDNIQTDISTIQQIRSNRPTHNKTLTFNEPDGSTASGGSNISPSDAARAYIQYILPLRPTFQISHPSTTSSGYGLNWLRSFNASCWEFSPGTGCPTDFVAAHFYGDFPALASYLGQLHDFYPDKQMYITEFALPQTTMNDTLRMMNQALPYLDALDYISGYAWFGMFRTTDANAWTGPGVSLLDASGGLSELGSVYLGGPERGFAVGQRSKARPGPVPTDAAARNELLGLVVAVAVAVGLWSNLA